MHDFIFLFVVCWISFAADYKCVHIFLVFCSFNDFLQNPGMFLALVEVCCLYM